MRNAPEKYNSLGYFNLARGLGILLILVGHSLVPFLKYEAPSAETTLFAGAGSVLGGGVMAMFFMISGFGFYSRSPRKCMSIQTKLLLKPYYLLALCFLTARSLLTLIRHRPFFETMKEFLITYLLGLNAENISALAGEPIKSVTIMWFILALFGAWVIYNSISRLKRARLKTCLVTACVVLSWVLTLFSKAWPFCLPMALLAVGYLSAGYYVKQHHLLNAKLPAWLWLLMLLVIVVSCALGRVDIGAAVWGMGLIDVTATFCIGFCLLRVYARYMELEQHGPVIQMLERIGNRSIWIVFIHAFEKTLFPWYALRNFFPDFPWLCTIICLVCRCLLIRGLYMLLSRLDRYLRNNRKKKIVIER